MRVRGLSMFVLGGMLTLGATAAFAQSPGFAPPPDDDAPPAPAPGSFRWQLQPFCNVVTLTMTQNGSVFRLEGTDDQCGAGGTPASAIGTAFSNADGTLALGLTLVASPDAAPTHVMARVGATLNGTWQDSGGNTGTFILTPGTSTGGNPRPTTGTIGGVSVNPSEIQLRVIGSCAAGQVMRAVNQDGSVACATTTGGDITGVFTAPANGLQGGAASGDVSLGLRRALSGAFDFTNVNGFVSAGTVFSGAIPASGPGTRLMWYPAKEAFRAGGVAGAHWDESNVGWGSVAMGTDTIASGPNSFAMGYYAVARGLGSIAMGFHTTAIDGGHAIGLGNTAIGTGAFALGRNSEARHGAFAFDDSSIDLPGFPKLVSYDNQFNVRATGGSGFYSNASLTAGVELRPGSSAWLSVSDANMKEHFRDLDDTDVLTKIARMPVREWNYKAQDASIRHMGPTAQDFHAAFGLGEDPLKISTIDADGVALRAIQALEARTAQMRAEQEVLNDENRALKAELAALRDRLDRLDARKDR